MSNLIIPPDIVLRAELEFFERHRMEWFEQAPGKYALVKNTELIGIFDTELEALREGYRRFLDDGFLVQRILQADVPLIFSTFNLGI